MTLHEAARRWAAAGWPVIALKVRGKQPYTPHAVKDATIDLAEIDRLWTEEPELNVGLAMGGGVLVLDVDGASGRARLDELEEEHGPLPGTRRTKTANGMHYFFSIPLEGPRTSNASIWRAPKDHPLGPGGLDIRTDGGYVVAAPSIHPSGHVYAMTGDHEAECPTWLYELVIRPEAEPPADPPPMIRSVPDGGLDPYQARAFASALERVRTCGKGGRNNTLNGEVHGLAKCGCPRDLVEQGIVAAALSSGLGAKEIADTFESGWGSGSRARVENPHERTRREFVTAVRAGLKIGEARHNFGVSVTQANEWLGPGDLGANEGTEPPPEPKPKGGGPPRQPGQEAEGDSITGSADVHDPSLRYPVPPVVRDDRAAMAWARDAGLKITEKGGIARTTANLAIMVRGIPGLAGLMRFNEFAQRAEFSGVPPWRRAGDLRSLVKDEIDDSEAMIWLQGQIKAASYEPGTIGQQLEMAARSAPYDPLQDFLRGLKWDGVGRLREMLTDLFGCPANEWTRAVSRRWMISAAARALQPGCKADCVLVLEGSQGVRKSSGLRALADAFPGAFIDQAVNVADKDSQALCAGAWIWEIQESAVFSKHEAGALKAFFSKTSDTYRPPYARKAITVPRRTVFAISVNVEGQGYLNDQSGNRRYWPVHARSVDLDGIKEHRAQLWAEAVHEYLGGSQWWLTGPESELAVDETEEREIEHPWVEAIRGAIKGHATQGITTLDILRGLGVETPNARGPDGVTVAGIVKRLGWVQRRVGKWKTRTWFDGSVLV